MVELLRAYMHWAVHMHLLCISLCYLESHLQTRHDPFVVPDKTFPSSMDILPDDVASLVKHLIAAFEAAWKNIAAALHHQGTKAKKYYKIRHQWLTAQFLGG